MIKSQIEQRLEYLGWTLYKLAKLVSAIKATRSGEKPSAAVRYHTAIGKALDNPDRSKLETLEEIIEALGGRLTIVWDNEPPGFQPTITTAPGEQLYLVKFFEQAGVRVSASSSLKDAISALVLGRNADIGVEIWHGNECLWSTEDIQPTTTSASYTVIVPDVLLPLDNRDWACCTK